MPAKKLQESTRQEFRALQHFLLKARESCVLGSGRDLRHKADQVQALLAMLDREDLRPRTADFDALFVQTAQVNADMNALKGQIRTVVQDGAVVAQIIFAIDRTAIAVGEMFASRSIEPTS